MTSSTIVAITAEQTLYAKWTVNSTVTFDAQGGTGPYPVSKNVTYASTYGTLATTSRTGYTFGGWWTEASGTGTQVTSSTTVTITTAQTLYAKWTAKNYTVTFSAQSGTSPSPSSKSVTYASPYGTLATTSRIGYTFAGWWTEAGGTGTEVTSSTAVTTTAAQTLYAKWTANSYTVTFEAQGGESPIPVSKSVTYASTYGTLATTSRAGFTFAGWWTVAGGTGSQVTSSTTVAITAAQTLYAKWTANTYTVTFDAQGGAAPNPVSKSVTYASTFGTLAATSRTGYTFGGWWTEAGGTGTEVTATTIVTITSAHTLYAKWHNDAYTVINGADSVPIGKTSAVQSCDENSGDGRTSIKLGGVGLIADGEMAGIEWTVTGPGVLSFDWKVSSEEGYDVLKFYEVGTGATNQISGTGIGWDRISVEAGGDTNTVHTYRWEYEKDPIGDYVEDDCGWVDAITWTPKYALTVNNGTGDGWNTNGTDVAISADAPAQYNEFDRWTGYTNGIADVFAPSTTLVMPSTNVAVTATYKPILYGLTVVNGTGSGEYAYGSIVEIGASSFGGKQFYRWTGDVETVSSISSASTTVSNFDHAISITATYSVPFTVNFGSGSGWHPEGSVVTVAADPDPLYMEFAEWTGDAAGLLDDASASTASLTMPTQAANLTATYRDSIARVSGSYGRTYTKMGAEGGISTDTGAGSPSGNAAVKLGGTGVVPDSGFVAFETVVSGSGSVTFWWKTSSEVNDYLEFMVDGVQIAAISGTKTPWTFVSNRVEGAGVDHILRWEYVKNASASSSTDAGWVDDIVWIGDVPMPAITPDIHTTANVGSQFKFKFWGERGIPYTVYSNATLSVSGWAPMDIEPVEIGETNGVFQYEATVVPPEDQTTGFYRVLGGDKWRGF